jgi:hypothetical protein
MHLIKRNLMLPYVPWAGEWTIAGGDFGVLYKGAETGSPPFFPLNLLEGVNEGEMTGAAPHD